MKAEETGMRISVYHFSAFLLWFGNNNSSFSSSSSSFHLRFLRHMRLLHQVRHLRLLRLLRLDFFPAPTCLEPATFWTKAVRATTRLAGQAILGFSFGQIHSKGRITFQKPSYIYKHTWISLEPGEFSICNNFHSIRSFRVSQILQNFKNRVCCVPLICSA